MAKARAAGVESRAAVAPADQSYNGAASTASAGSASVKSIEDTWRQKAPANDQYVVVQSNGKTKAYANKLNPSGESYTAQNYLVSGLKGLKPDASVLMYNSYNEMSGPHSRMFSVYGPNGNVVARGPLTDTGGIYTAGGLTPVAVSDAVNDNVKEIRITNRGASGARTYVLRRMDDKAYPNRGSFAKDYSNAIRGISRNWAPIAKPTLNPNNPNADPNSPRNAREWLSKNAKKYGYEFFVR